MRQLGMSHRRPEQEEAFQLPILWFIFQSPQSTEQDFFQKDSRFQPREVMLHMQTFFRLSFQHLNSPTKKYNPEPVERTPSHFEHFSSIIPLYVSRIRSVAGQGKYNTNSYELRA